MGAPFMAPLWAILALTPVASRASRLSSGWQPALPTVTGLMPLIVANPTPAPEPPGAPELLRRADSKTCVYISGVEAGAITCSAGYTCSTNSFASVFECCPTGATRCYMPTACLDYVAYKSGLCESRGTSTTCCSKFATPYCAVVALVDKPSVSLVGCLEEKTYIGVYANTTGPPGSVAVPTTSTTASKTSSSSALPSTSTATQSPSSESSLAIGPIVGGAVGGLAILAITAAVIAWLMVRARRNNKFSGEGQLQAQQHQAPSAGQPVSPYGRSGHLSFASWTQTNESTAASPGIGGPDPFFKDAVTVTQAQAPPSQTSPVAVAQHQRSFPPQAHGGFQVQPSDEHPQFQPGVYASELPVALQTRQQAGE